MKISAIAAAVTALLVVGGTGVVYSSGKTANDEFDQAVAASMQADSPIRIEVIDRTKGFLASSGTVRVALNQGCIGPDIDTSGISALVKYSINHVPDQQGWSAYDASLSLEGAAGEFLVDHKGDAQIFQIASHYGFDSKWQASFGTPAFDIRENGVRFELAASTGELVDVDVTGAYAWKLPALTVTTQTAQYDLRGMSMAGYVDDPSIGLGKQTINVETIVVQGDNVGAGLSVNGFRTDLESKAVNGMVSSLVRPSVTNVQMNGQSFENLSVSMLWERLDEQALRTIDELASTGCQTSMTDDQLKQIEQALFRLLDHGASFSIQDLQGSQNGNTFGGNVKISLAEAGVSDTGGARPLIERVRATADVDVSAVLVPPPVRDMVMQRGLVSHSGERFSTSLRFTNGELLLNGVSDPFGTDRTAGMFMVMGDAAIENWRNEAESGMGPLLTLARATR